MLGFQKIVFPDMKPGEEVLLHPLGLAGVIGLYFNLWHLFPAGRLDGGRVVYALFGYRTALIVSWVTIALLALLAVVWPGWLATAAFAALTMIRLKRQHPVERHEQPRDPATLRLTGAMLVILVLTFVPVPTKVPLQSAPPMGQVASTAGVVRFVARGQHEEGSVRGLQRWSDRDHHENRNAPRGLHCFLFGWCF